MEENHLVTCSLDRTIKFWDYLKDVDEPDHVIHASFPVWRARHTPFGYGLLAMPQRGDHDLHLYDRRNSRTEGVKQTTSTVHKFGGHDDQVKEFLWRPRGIVTESVDDREFQLVSWGTDRILRLHQVSEDVLREVGYKKGMQVQPNLNITRRNAAYKTFRDIPNDNEDGGPASIESLTSGHQGRLGTLSTLTAGMSRAPVPFIGGFGNRDSVYPMMGRKSAFAKEMDAISWMRGVKIGKRESSPSGVHQSVSSIHSPSAKTDTTWDVFESLGEEITNVADKFSKVTFDEVYCHPFQYS